MRLRTAFGTVGLCLLTSGCQLTWDITRNLAFEAYLFTDTTVSKVEYWHTAHTAWKEYSARHPERLGSRDFAKGFIDGYATFLEWGGSELPPPAPPKKYWKCRYQNKEGRIATAMWGAGYKEGASTAKASGVRDYIVVPYNKVGPPEPPPGAPPGPVAGPVLPSPAIAAPPPGPASELPPPRPDVKEPVPPPIDKGDAAKPTGPQAGLDQLGPGESDGGQNAEITLTDTPIAPATLSSPRVIPPNNR
jgi:hypothetical protein